MSVEVKVVFRLKNDEGKYYTGEGKNGHQWGNVGMAKVYDSYHRFMDDIREQKDGLVCFDKFGLGIYTLEQAIQIK